MFELVFFLGIILFFGTIAAAIYTKSKDSGIAYILTIIFAVSSLLLFSADVYLTTGRARTDVHFKLKTEYRVMAVDESHPKFYNLTLVDEDGATYLYAISKEDFAAKPSTGDRIIRFSLGEKPGSLIKVLK